MVAPYHSYNTQNFIVGFYFTIKGVVLFSLQWADPGFPRRGGAWDLVGAGVWTPEAVTFRKFLYVKTKELGTPWGGGACQARSPPRSANALHIVSQQNIFPNIPFYGLTRTHSSGWKPSLMSKLLYKIFSPCARSIRLHNL